MNELKGQLPESVTILTMPVTRRVSSIIAAEPGSYFRTIGQPVQLWRVEATGGFTPIDHILSGTDPIVQVISAGDLIRDVRGKCYAYQAGTIDPIQSDPDQ